MHVGGERPLLVGLAVQPRWSNALMEPQAWQVLILQAAVCSMLDAVPATAWRLLCGPCMQGPEAHRLPAGAPLDVWSYSALIKGYVQGGDVARARKVLQQMQAAGVPGNEVCWDCLAPRPHEQIEHPALLWQAHAAPRLPRHPSSSCHAQHLPPCRRLLGTGLPAAPGQPSHALLSAACNKPVPADLQERSR